jgi:hypothetical protein
MELEGRNDFVELAEDFVGVDGLFGGFGDHGSGVCNLKMKFVACAADERGVDTGGVVHVTCEFTGFPPVKEDSVDGGSADGVVRVWIGGSDERLADFWRDGRIDDESQRPAAKGGIGIGVRRNVHGGNEDGAGLAHCEFLLSLESVRVFGIEIFV